MGSLLSKLLCCCLVILFFAIPSRVFFIEALSSTTRRSRSTTSTSNSMQSVPSTSIPISLGSQQYTLIGRSRAGDGTTFIIPELKWMFDCGALVDNGGLKQPTTIFLTHTHSDHIFTLAHFTHRRELAEKQSKKQQKMKIYLPEKALPLVQSYLHAYNAMITMEQQPQESSSTTKSSFYELIPVKPNHEISIKQGGKEFVIRIIECVHRIDCVGYSIFENQKKLKDEYKGLKGVEIGKLRKSGVEITSNTTLPLLCYLGDTTHDVLTRNHPEILQQHSIVVVECSFLEEENIENAKRHKHMNWIHLKPIINSHPNILFILTHFSLRYGALYLREFFNQQSTHRNNIHPMLIESEIQDNWYTHHKQNSDNGNDDDDNEQCKSEATESSSSSHPPKCNCFVCQPPPSS